MTNPIGWCEETWSPITGCSKVSPACDNCYAERMSKRLAGRFSYPADEPFRVTFHPDKLDEPLRWRKPRRVFVCSMSDLFHEDVTDEQIAQIWQAMGTERHTFLVLTKRPERMRQWLARCADWEGWITHDGTPPAKAYDGTGIIVGYASRVPASEKNKINPARVTNWPQPNIWLGVTAEDQQRADERIPILLDTPAAKRFVSVEPMLGPVDLDSCGAFGTYHMEDDAPGTCRQHRMWDGNGLDWVICGGEAGPGARPMHPEWVRSVRDQCQAAGVPFYFKQWGEWAPQGWGAAHPQPRDWKWPDGSRVWRLGKKAAGHLLDGREYHEFPED